MRKMLQSMTYFIFILLVVLISSGVCRQAILHPAEGLSWSAFLEIFLEPYLMLFGEVFAETINSACIDNPDCKMCETGVWINVILMGIFLLVVNYGLINLFTAIGSNIFDEVRAISHQVWIFHRFTIVQEYQQTPVLPAPLIVLCHIFLFLNVFSVSSI
jgi:transient receptor potential cation channel subfamily M protein 3